MTQDRNISGRKLRSALAGFGVVPFLFALAVLADDTAPNETFTARFRLGFSSATFTAVNENDAKAGIKVWARTLLSERGQPVDPEPVVLKDPEAINEALRGALVDAITLNTDEYWKLDRELVTGPFIGGLNEGRITEEYVLLVHRDSKWSSLESLRGRSLVFFQNSRMSLASVWLDTVLLEGGFTCATNFCQVTAHSKLTKVVLPVFFRQADACVVTLRGFKTMAELNPQVGQRLKVLATSPELVPTGFIFRRGYTDSLKETIVLELAKIKDSPAGQQVLTLFQSGSLEAHPLACLDRALALLETHRRMTATVKLPPAASSAAIEAVNGGTK